MKKLNIPCDFGKQRANITVYIGAPRKEAHPIQFQANWLAKQRGGTIPQEIMDSFTKLMALSEKNGVPFEELCTYAIEAATTPVIDVGSKAKDTKEE